MNRSTPLRSAPLRSAPRRSTLPRRFALLCALALAAVGCKKADPPPKAPEAPKAEAGGLPGDPQAAGLPRPGTPLDGIPIVNVHEHIQSTREAGRLLAAMDQTGIARSVLMGSSWFTVTLNQADGFTRVDWNNRQILHIAGRHPDRFLAWPTIDPTDPKKLEALQEYVSLGATGLKLYLGHGLHDLRPGATGYFFHPVAMDDPGMMPIYEYCQRTGLPIMFHVNPGPTAPGFADEFITVMRRFPDMKVIAPHFILSSIKSSRLRAFLDAFPNLYSDLSFGHDDFLSAGLKRISRSPKKFKKIMRDYPDRFMFGTDVVVTAAPQKSAEWIAERIRAYLDMLSKDEYTTPVVPGETLKGLGLDREALERVLYKNFEAFMAKKPSGTQTGPIEWKKLGIPETPREPGTQLPRDLWKKDKGK